MRSPREPVLCCAWCRHGERSAKISQLRTRHGSRRVRQGVRGEAHHMTSQVQLGWHLTMTPVPPFEGSDRPFSARRSSACSVSFTVMPTRATQSRPTSRSYSGASALASELATHVGLGRGARRPQHTSERSHARKHTPSASPYMRIHKTSRTDVETDTDIVSAPSPLIACRCKFRGKNKQYPTTCSTQAVKKTRSEQAKSISFISHGRCPGPWSTRRGPTLASAGAYRGLRSRRYSMRKIRPSCLRGSASQCGASSTCFRSAHILAGGMSDTVPANTQGVCPRRTLSFGCAARY